MVMATMGEAHREWHQNSGTPMGLPGCPMDACHLEDLDPKTIRRLQRQELINHALMAGEEGDAVINHRGHVHLSVAAVRFCDAPPSDEDRAEWATEERGLARAEGRAKALAERSGDL